MTSQQVGSYSIDGWMLPETEARLCALVALA
jgi:hypothetical protein